LGEEAVTEKKEEKEEEEMERQRWRWRWLAVVVEGEPCGEKKKREDRSLGS